jgi:HAD superfamily hydrolase (TIGR01549 family)
VSIRAIFFDIGETLFNETRPWTLLADWLGVPSMTMFGVLGGLIAEGRDHRELFEIVRPDIGWDGVRTRFNKEVGDGFLYGDLYPDVVPCLERLKERGYFVGIAGNQPARQEENLQGMGLPNDLIATSGSWGVRKPDSEFFRRIVDEVDLKPNQIAYVGDRVDNDVVPAAEFGLVPIHLIRGPWGYLHRNLTAASRAHAQLTTLDDLPECLDRLSEE